MTNIITLNEEDAREYMRMFAEWFEKTVEGFWNQHADAGAPATNLETKEKKEP